MRTIFILIITIIIGGVPSKDKVTVKNTQNCSAELTVDKDRSFKSADENGVEFILTLTNRSNSYSSFNLSASKLSLPCSNKPSENISSLKNSDLDISFKTNNNALSNNQIKQNSIITLEVGQSKEFIMNAIVPEGTPYNTWGCIGVKANSIECNSVSAEIVLSVYIPDPTEG